MLVRLWIGLSVLALCLASEASGNDHGDRSRPAHRTRPGVVWAITKSAEENANEIVFYDLPQTAAHLQGIVGLRLDQASTGNQQVHVQINGDTALSYNTSAWRFASNGVSGVLPGCGIGVGQIVLGVVDSESQYTFTISDYSSEERKKDLSAHGWAVTGFFPSNVLSILSGGVHTGTYEPVQSLRFYLSEPGGRFSVFSKITLYGLSDGP